MRFLAAILFFVASTGVAMANCEPAPAVDNGDIPFFLGMQPSDGPLDAWCRLQALSGDFRFNIMFPSKEVNAHRTFEVTFDGNPGLGKEVFASYLQSVLPTEAAPAKDANGMNFGLVLKNSMQGQARFAPDDQLLGFPSTFPAAKEIAIWEPLTLRVRPIILAGREFSLEVNFKPSVGRFLLGLNGDAEDLIVRGWHENVLPGATRKNCPENIPECKELPDLIDLHTPWVFDSMILRATGDNLSAAAVTVLGQLEAEQVKFIKYPSMRSFDPAIGAAKFDAQSPAREMLARADGDPQGTNGSKGVRVMWREVRNSKLSYDYALRAYAKKARDEMVLNAATQ